MTNIDILERDISSLLLSMAKKQDELDADAATLVKLKMKLARLIESKSDSHITNGGE